MKIQEQLHKEHLPLEGFFSKPIPLPQSAEKDGIFAGRVLPGDVHLWKSQNPTGFREPLINN